MSLRNPETRELEATSSLEQIALDVSQTRTRRSRDGREIRKEIYVHLHSLLK